MTTPPITGQAPYRPPEFVLDVQADAAHHRPAMHRPQPTATMCRMEPRTSMNERPAA